ncbi:MAG: hypothetical protein WC775_06140 [Patescibacteria group bacterium]|jgi:hypothetical protein
MATADQAEPSEAKRESGHVIIGHQEAGGILILDGRLYALRHNEHRWNGDTSEAWGRPDAGYTANDAPEIHVALSPIPDTTASHRRAMERLEVLRSGEIPTDSTTGAELEGGKYSPDGRNLLSAYPGNDASDASHPELLAPTIETATNPLRNGSYARTPVEVAQEIARAAREAHELAQINGGIVAFSSLYESGRPDQVALTPHGYLLSFAPKVLRDTVNDAHNIPEEVVEMYRRVGIPDITAYLTQSGVLNWPTHALHVHSGVPRQEDGLADPRCALAMGAVRLTQFAKLPTFMMGNTRHVYGEDMGYRGDARAIMRRLLATSRNQDIPLDVNGYFQHATEQLTSGAIHSLDRYPAGGQHCVLRVRMGGTVESIDAPMNPDLRIDLMWIYFNQIMNVIGLDALAAVNGNEKFVLPYLHRKWGGLFSLLPAMGEHSSYAEDCAFNREHLNARVPHLNNWKIGDLLAAMGPILQYYSQKYPAIELHAQVVWHHIVQATAAPLSQTQLSDYMGIQRGNFEPNRLNRGIVTDYKVGQPVNELVALQAEGTQLQATALATVQDDRDLKAFFGI